MELEIELFLYSYFYFMFSRRDGIGGSFWRVGGLRKEGKEGSGLVVAG